MQSVGYAERGEGWPPDVLVVRPEDGPHRHLAVTWPAFWWLEHYSGFAQYLGSHSRSIAEDDNVLVFQLTGVTADYARSNSTAF